MSSFGTSFVLINDICQPIKAIKFKEGYAIHHATIQRGVDEYIVFSNPKTNETYIEKVEHNRAIFSINKINDENEWLDITAFCISKGIMDITGIKKYAN